MTRVHIVLRLSKLATTLPTPSPVTLLPCTTPVLCPTAKSSTLPATVTNLSSPKSVLADSSRVGTKVKTRLFVILVAPAYTQCFRCPQDVSWRTCQAYLHSRLCLWSPWCPSHHSSKRDFDLWRWTFEDQLEKELIHFWVTGTEKRSSHCSGAIY